MAPIVTICGSMRLAAAMAEAAIAETLAGRIVLMPHVNLRETRPEWADHTDRERIKAALDRLHRQKIDLADEVCVVTDTHGYLGNSTRAEITYARRRGKPIRYRTFAVQRPGLLAAFARDTPAYQTGPPVEQP